MYTILYCNELEQVRLDDEEIISVEFVTETVVYLYEVLKYQAAIGSLLLKTPQQFASFPDVAYILHLFISGTDIFSIFL